MYPVAKQNNDITYLIENKKVITYFQPIVSVIRKSLIGLEGLRRGTTEIQGELIPPELMFRQALDFGLTIELDRLCREKALNAFQDIYHLNKDVLLFLNIDASILDQVVGSKYLLTETIKKQLPVNNIVIEINETKVNDLQCLKTFIENYREYGFLIALDDVGSGFFKFGPYPTDTSDIIKIDKGMSRTLKTIL
jgi:EAL domain-containing protein (putative c-di-GMP-specific phosphodiesterase class I)